MSTMNIEERTGIVTFKGTSMTLQGPALNVGDPAPDFSLTSGDLSRLDLDLLLDGADAALLIAVPSLDTGVCSLEAQTFNKRFAELPTGVKAYVVSMDLPFAQARWCGAQENVSLIMLSDYRDHSFGLNYGLLIAELGLLARAVIVIGKDRTIRYVEIVPEIATEPNYDRALKAAASAA